MKYDIYMCIQNIDDYYNTIYEKNIEVKNMTVRTCLKNSEEVKNKKDMEEEINKLKEKCNKNASYTYEYNIVKKLF